MKTIYVPIGQRGSGKTTYCNKIIEKRSDIVLISRDDILVRYNGSTNICPYSFNYPHVARIIYRLLRLKLSNKKNEKILFDYFTGDSEDRKKLIGLLKNCGATKIIALYFVTPLEFVSEWFWQKPDVAKASEMKKRRGENNLAFYSDSAPQHDYEVFHELATEIDSDSFDKVIRINPTNDIISL